MHRLEHLNDIIIGNFDIVLSTVYVLFERLLERYFVTLTLSYYAPNFEEVEGAYWFGSVRPVVSSQSVMRE